MSSQSAVKREQSISMVLFIPQAMGSSNNAEPAMIHLDRIDGEDCPDPARVLPL
jgi:hypothetical protein